MAVAGRRKFVLDTNCFIDASRSCREMGAILISRNATDLSKIANVFAFDFVPPYPPQSHR
jgi:hypothetical protein